MVIAHGFQLPANQYTSYAAHLATFGYVACTADYPNGVLPNHVASARDLIGSLDHLASVASTAGSPLAGMADASRTAIVGHSLGGKLAVIAASLDTRIDAIVGLDPVDGSMLCNATRCPDATNLLPLPIPFGILGETLDATSTRGQACAPTADNYQTFYEAAGSPALEVTVNGANHMSFLDDPSRCGAVCSFCNSPTAPHAEVIELARAYTAAFLERHLKGLTAYDDYLTGPLAQSRYVQPGRATLRSK